MGQISFSRNKIIDALHLLKRLILKMSRKEVDEGLVNTKNNAVSLQT